ncbi:hypothetical protein [Brachybacterium phenoliresistens]|uniref:hypothetical protein n=1 Tax=Brachybacterium phenoliresistens TaxID=396014 RepID=UPI0031D50D26
MFTTTPTAQDRTAVDAPILYRPLDPAWGDAGALAELRAIRAARTREDARDLEMAQTALRAEHAHRADLGPRPAAGPRARRRHGQHRGDGLRLFGHRFA